MKISLKSQAFIKRFIKGFLGGAFGAMAVVVKAGIVITSWHDLKTVGFVLLGATITGGILAVEKMLTWEEVQ